MMFKVAFLALALSGMVAAGPTQPPAPTQAPAPGASDCTKYLVDQCKPASSGDPQVEVIHNADVSQCAFFCNTIYATGADNCKFYILDAKQKICEIWKISMDDYQKGCTKHEGPVGDTKDNTAAKCKVPATGTDCKAVREGGCMFEGNLMEHLNDIKDEETCQQACQHIPNCKYYIWDSSNVKNGQQQPGDCELLDSDKRQGDLIILPAKAEIKEYDMDSHTCE